MEEFLKVVTARLAHVAEGIAAVIIAAGLIRAAISWLIDQFQDRTGAIPKESIRLSLGRSLALALEFLLGADILNTAITPTWNQIAQLAAIAAIRTALNFFLQRELREDLDRNRSSSEPAGASGPEPAGASGPGPSA